jgi:GNAT superfamily N-acetyltransferase
MRRPEKYELIPAADAPVEVLARFYQVAFPSRAQFLINHWRWHYSGIDPSNLAEWPLLAIDTKGEILGHVSTIPTNVTCRGRVFRGSWFVDFFVMPKARGLGIGGALIQRVMGAAALMMAIGASSYSLPIFRRYNWVEIEGTVKYSNILRLSEFPRIRKLRFPSLVPKTLDLALNFAGSTPNRIYGTVGEVVDITAAPSQFLQGWECLSASDHDAKPPSRDFVQWRLDANPLGGRLFLHTTDYGKALTRVFSRNGIRELNILSIESSNTDRVLAHLLHWASTQKMSRISLVTSCKKIQSCARRWFLFKRLLTPFYFSNDPNLLSVIMDSPPDWQMIDGDIDLALPDDDTVE